MFDVRIGPQTTSVECPMLEGTYQSTIELEDNMNVVLNKLDQILGAQPGQPRIDFTIGPVREQRSSTHGTRDDRNPAV